ncbi:MAG: cytidine deaminase, partial [Thaumarchaeota archaeon S15]
MATTVTAIRAPRREGPFDLFAEVSSALDAAGERLGDGDVVVISSKYAAVSQGRTVTEASVAASAPARAL